MAIQNFFTSRDNNLDGNTYVGQLGRLWYNPDTNSLYASDGVTVGGVPVDLATGADIIANVITVNTITSTSNTVAVTGNLTISGNISPAGENKIGGIIPGPGANISNTGLLTIDTSGLPLSFGNFTANNNILTIVNADENMILATSGSAEIQLVGNIGFYRTNGLPPSANNRYFQASEDGQISILVPNVDPILGAVEIIGSSTGNTIAPGITGAMLHVTGQLGDPCRLYYDGNGNYVSWVARRWNGNVAAPTQVLAGQDVLRINATAATDSGVGNVAMAQISFHALENQTTTAQGSKIDFTVTPVGSPASARVDVANVTVANGVSATQFTTAGNVIANAIVSAEGSGGNIFVDCNLLPEDANCNLGSPDRPWAEAYFGPQSLTLLDSTGNVANTVVIQNVAGNITMDTAGFEIQTLGTNTPIFRIEAITGQIFSNAVTAIVNVTDAANATSGSLRTAGGGGIAKNLYVGNNIVATGNITGGNLISLGSFQSSSLLATGNVTGGNLITSGLISATGNITAGNVNSFVTLTAGTTTKAPLVFTAGNILATPAAGAVGYDGRVFYATPQSNERGLVVTEQVFVPNTDYTILNQTGVQSMFGVSVTLSSATRYAYRILSTIYKTSNNISLQFAEGGTAVLARHSYQTLTTATTSLALASAPSVVKNILTSGFTTPVTVSGSLNGTGYYSLTVNGLVNVTTGGTWFPQIGFTGLPGAGSYVAAGSSIEIWPVGPTGANVSIGNWT